MFLICFEYNYPVSLHNVAFPIKLVEYKLA